MKESAEKLPEPKFVQYPEITHFPCCGCGTSKPKEKMDCYFYNGVRDMGGIIPTCRYHQKLGYCPCEECEKYVDGKEVHSRVYDAVKEYVDKRG